MLGTTVADNTTTVVAASAVSSPLWLPTLQEASQIAAMIAPILGVIWLVVQIIAKLHELYLRSRDEDEPGS